MHDSGTSLCATCLPCLPARPPSTAAPTPPPAPSLPNPPAAAAAGGWWHIVLNLEEAAAITQNFVTEVTLPHALAFLARGRDNPDLVSGCPEGDRSVLYDRFVGALARERPEVLERAQAELDARRRKLEVGAWAWGCGGGRG